MTFIRTKPSGISAVVLRRGGKLTEVSVPTLLREAQGLDPQAICATSIAMTGLITAQRFTWRKKTNTKPTKRKGAKKR